MTHDPRALLAAKRKRSRWQEILDDMRAELFEEQLKLASDPAPRKSVNGGRRCGKTAGYPYLALEPAITKPGSTVGVVETTITCDAAEKAWEYFIHAGDKHKIPWKVHATYKRLTLPPPISSTIEFRGAMTLEGCNILRGGAFSRLLIDEAATFRHHVLDYLLNDVASASLVDWDGDLILSGSPGAVLKGPYYDACLGKGGWSPHHWDMLANPHVPKLWKGDDASRRARREAILAEEAMRLGGTDQPRFLREWRGLWVSSSNELMYGFDRTRNVWAEPLQYNPDTWTTGIGCDVGFNVPSAWVVLGQRDGDPTIYVLESYQKEGLIPTQWAMETRALRTKYNPKFIVVDSGGLGKGYVEEGTQTFKLPLLAANKRRKAAFVEFARGDLLSGRVQFLSDTNLDIMADLEQLPWNEDHTDSAPGFPDHLADAFLYAHRQLAAPDDQERTAAEPPKGSDGWWARELDRMERLDEMRHLVKMGELDEDDLPDDWDDV